MNPRLGPALMRVGTTTLVAAAILYLLHLHDTFVRCLMAVETAR